MPLNRPSQSCSKSRASAHIRPSVAALALVLSVCGSTSLAAQETYAQNVLKVALDACGSAAADLPAFIDGLKGREILNQEKTSDGGILSVNYMVRGPIADQDVLVALGVAAIAPTSWSVFCQVQGGLPTDPPEALVADFVAAVDQTASIRRAGGTVTSGYSGEAAHFALTNWSQADVNSTMWINLGGSGMSVMSSFVVQQ